MRSFKRLTGIAAAVALLSVTTVAQAAPAHGSSAKLSLSARASTAGKSKSAIHGSTAIVAILAVAAVVGGTILILHKSKSP